MQEENTVNTEDTDLLGAPLTRLEREFMRLYADLKALTGRDDLPPCVARNLRQALASMWQVTNDLDLQFEQLYDLGT
jgi:hypothetical protein